MSGGNLHPVDAESCHSASGGDDVTSERRHGPRDMADHVADILVRQCKSWTTKHRGVDDADSLPASNTLSLTAAGSSTSPTTVSRPPPSPRPSLTNVTRPSDPRSPALKSDSSVEPPSAYFFTSNSTEDVVVVDAAVPATPGSDTSSGRGSASPDTRPSSRGKSRFKKMLRPLRRTRSAGCSDDFMQKFDDAASHKATGVQQVIHLHTGCSVNSAVQ